MEKFDARKLPREAQDEMRRQAMRISEITWKEIARVVGVHVSTVIGWSKRYSMEGSTGLKSKTRGRRYLSGRTLTLAQEWQLRSVIVGENPKQLSLPFALWNRRDNCCTTHLLYAQRAPLSKRRPSLAALIPSAR